MRAENHKLGFYRNAKRGGTVTHAGGCNTAAPPKRKKAPDPDGSEASRVGDKATLVISNRSSSAVLVGFAGRTWGTSLSQNVYRCPRCSGGVEPYYFAAFNEIDWSLPADRIGDRQAGRGQPIPTQPSQPAHWVVIPLSRGRAGPNRAASIVRQMQTRTTGQTLGFVGMTMSHNYPNQAAKGLGELHDTVTTNRP